MIEIPKLGRYSLKVFQQPCRARMVGNGERADRRPVDPPPVLKLEILDRTEAPPAVDITLLRSPYFMCYGILCQPNPPYEELFATPHSGKPYMVGSFVSSSVHLREDYDIVPAGHYFLFCDIGVRIEGFYRLKFSVFEIVDHQVILCASTMSDQFQVFSAKNFPGMNRPTPISRILAKQGIRMRLRKKNNETTTTTTNNNNNNDSNSNNDTPTPTTPLEMITTKIKPTLTPINTTTQKSKSLTTTTTTTTMVPGRCVGSIGKRKPIEIESKKKHKRKSTRMFTEQPNTTSTMSPINEPKQPSQLKQLEQPQLLLLPTQSVSRPAQLFHVRKLKMAQESTRVLPSIDHMLKSVPHHQSNSCSNTNT